MRTQGGLWQLLWLEPWLLGPGNRIWLHFVSHKLGRLLLPFVLAVLLVASAWLDDPWRLVLLVGQGVLYGLAAIDGWVGEGNPCKRLTSPARTITACAAGGGGRSTGLLDAGAAAVAAAGGKRELYEGEFECGRAVPRHPPPGAAARWCFPAGRG
jgi:hypothetical protein